VRDVSYSILFRQFPLDHLDALAPVLARAYGITDFDARTKIRKGWGFLDRQATEEDARRLAEAVGDLAGGVAAIDNARLRAAAEPKVMLAFEPAETGLTLRLQSPRDPTRVIGWSEIRVAAAGGFTEETIVRESGGDQQKVAQKMIGLGVFMVTGIPVGLFGGGKKKKQAEPIKSKRMITFGRIVTKSGEQFAFSPDHFDFAGLGERRQMTAAANFRVFFEELARRTPAGLNLGARLLLENRSLTFANYSGLHDFETELLWLMNAGTPGIAPRNCP
jgi:hypothetical protein